jgi:integrase
MAGSLAGTSGGGENAARMAGRMPRVARELSPAAVRRLMSAIGVHAVGGVRGLYLQVTNARARSWILRATGPDGRRREFGLGSFPEVDLAHARARARDLRVAITDGRDPAEEKRAARRERIAARVGALTFKEAAERVLAVKTREFRNPKHAAQWRSTLETYAFPILGALPVADITTGHILEVLEPLWTTKTETAGRLRLRVEAVIDAAAASGVRLPDGNPARWRGHLAHHLPKPSRVARKRKQPSLPYSRIGEFMRDLRRRDGTTARALEFAILTAARSGAVRGATWSEVDLKAKVWTIPASRAGVKAMGDAPPDVELALADDAVKLLRALSRGEPEELLFRRNGEALSENAFGSLLARMHAEHAAAGGAGYIDPKLDGHPRITQHGFRASFRTWAADATDYDDAIAELALGHRVGNGVVQAYRRTTLLEKRRALARDWARFCASKK